MSMQDSINNDIGGFKILHGFADYGCEGEALSTVGSVTRATINPKENQHDEPVKTDLSKPERVPFKRNTFDLAVFHPPCTRYSTMPDANKNGDAEDLISEAREIGGKCSDHYIIENKPKAPLKDPIVLEGEMFGLPIEYKRAFETSFNVCEPPRYSKLTKNAETSPFYYSERSVEWWKSVKGLREDYPKQHIAKNAVPIAFLNHLLRGWFDEIGHSKGESDYTDYNSKMDVKRSELKNHSLDNWKGANTQQQKGVETK